MFTFPEPFELELRLKDMLESEVDESFYIQDERLEKMIEHKKRNQEKGNGFGARFVTGEDIASGLTTSPEKSSGQYLKMEEPKINMLGLLDIKGTEQVRRVYGDDGLAPTLNTMQGGNRQPKILVKEATKKGYAEAEEGDSINLEQPNSKTGRGRVGKQITQTLTTSCNQGVVIEKMKVRKLTPKECFRLMGFADGDFEKIKGISNSQLYKQAGNSIVVKVLEYLLKSIMAAVDFGEGTSEFEVKANNKLIIFKAKYIMPEDKKDELREKLKRQVQEGVIVLDQRIDYEVI